MEFTCNDPIRGDKIVQLGETVALVVHKTDGDDYFLIQGQVVEKQVQLAYSTKEGHDRMCIVLDTQSIRLLKSSIKFAEPKSEEDFDPRLKNTPKLIEGATVCDIYDDIDQAYLEYQALVPNRVPMGVGPMIRPNYMSPQFGQALRPVSPQHKDTRRG